MNASFWSEVQKLWRRILSSDEKRAIEDMAQKHAEEWAEATIINPYHKNPLNDFFEGDDDDLN